MSVYVFLGPSLPVAQARSLLDATYLPPAQAGDVYKLTQRDAKVIAIVDGFFEQVPSVWHKEVLYALSRGIHVFGASSMGALRAAELHAFGMVGVGRIFEMYRDGICEDDDEVTVVHGPASSGFKPLSEAMMNIRHTLGKARDRKILTPLTHDVLVRSLKQRHYAERSWALVPEIAKAEKLPRKEIEAFVAFAKEERTSLKGLDTIELLAKLKAFVASTPASFQPSFQFEATVFWMQLAGAVRSAPTTSKADVPIDAIRSHLAIVEVDAESVFHGALFLYLAAKEAQRLGLRAEPEEIARVAERFRRARGLQTAAATHAWLEKNHAGQAEFTALMELLALVEAVLAHHANGVDAFLPAELQRTGRLAPVADAILEKKKVLHSLGLTFPSPEDVGTTSAELMAWYESRFRRIDAPFDEHRKSRGVADRARFLREVLAEYLRTTGGKGASKSVATRASAGGADA